MHVFDKILRLAYNAPAKSNFCTNKRRIIYDSTKSVGSRHSHINYGHRYAYTSLNEFRWMKTVESCLPDELFNTIMCLHIITIDFSKNSKQAEESLTRDEFRCVVMKDTKKNETLLHNTYFSSNTSWFVYLL